jgi:death-on-curing protein
VDKQALLMLHDESLAEHGDLSGLRDERLLDSAHSRPQNLAANGKPNVADLAASHTVGSAKNPSPFDVNKRTAFPARGLLLFGSGYRFTATQADATVTILAVAAEEIDEAELAAWARQ